MDCYQSAYLSSNVTVAQHSNVVKRRRDVGGSTTQYQLPSTDKGIRLSKYTVSSSSSVCKHSAAGVTSRPLRVVVPFHTNSPALQDRPLDSVHIHPADPCTARSRRYGHVHVQSVLAQVPKELEDSLPLGPVTWAEAMHGMVIRVKSCFFADSVKIGIA